MLDHLAQWLAKQSSNDWYGQYCQLLINDQIYALFFFYFLFLGSEHYPEKNFEENFVLSDCLAFHGPSMVLFVFTLTSSYGICINKCILVMQSYIVMLCSTYVCVWNSKHHAYLLYSTASDTSSPGIKRAIGIIFWTLQPKLKAMAGIRFKMRWANSLLIDEDIENQGESALPEPRNSVKFGSLVHLQTSLNLNSSHQQMVNFTSCHKSRKNLLEKKKRLTNPLK